MIVMAVTVILLTAVFAVNFRITGLWASERGRSELQQNFRFATDHIATTVRTAYAILQPSVASGAGQNVMSDVLEFFAPERENPTQPVCYTYRLAGTGTDRHHIEEVVQDAVQIGGLWYKTGSPEPLPRWVTEDIRSLAAVHFVYTGPKVIVIMVAEYSALGSMKSITYTSQTYLRTLDPSATNH